MVSLDSRSPAERPWLPHDDGQNSCLPALADMSTLENASETTPAMSPLGLEVFEAFQRAPFLSNKHSSYFQTYGELFEKYRGKPITFVEIGVFSGGSLFMWRDYFGPQARIIGVEFNPDAIRWREHGFEIHIGSQSDPEFWENFFKAVGPVDLVLDDGGHTYEQQISTVHYCLPHVKNGGMIAVEDAHTSYFKDFGYPSRYTFMEWVKVLIDNINSRFHAVHASQLPYSQSIHSVEAFESIVAFKINRADCKPGHPVTNGGQSVNPQDYRFKDFEAKLWYFPSFLENSKFGRKLKNSLAKRASRAHLQRLQKFFE